MDQPNSNHTLVMRATEAQKEYAAAIADVNRDSQHAIEAIAAYGEALLVGRQEHAGKAFTQWVTANNLDAGEPWGQAQSRTCAMRIAEIVRDGSVPQAFRGCQSVSPVHVIRWWRKQHPKPKTAAQLKAEAARAAKQAERKAATTQLELLSEEQQLEKAEAGFSAKSKLTIEKAIALHKKRLDKQWWQRLGEEVRKEIAKADQAVRKQNAELQREVESLRKMVRGQGGGILSQKDFRQLQMCVHPDNTASTEMRNRMLDLLVRAERRLVGYTGGKAA